MLTFSFSAVAQKGKVEGKVTDAKTGNKLSGVSVSTDGKNAIAVSNTEGYFVITLDAGKKYTLKLSSVGFSTKELADVEVTTNAVVNIEVQLEYASKTETNVIIKSSVRKESVAALIAYQKNTPVVAQVISAEAIRRSPDKNTGDVLKRVSGASLQEGKYIIVRGLADRYNQAMLNGILLSSTEPDRKTFSFDIFPAAMIDNIIINKSFVPELPGEWAGALIQVNTKDVPAKNFFTAQFGTGFNTQTINHDFYSYKGSSTDFLGFDNGKRGLPDGFLKKSDFSNLDNAQKTAYGNQFENTWSAEKKSSIFLPSLNQSLQLSGGFNIKLKNPTNKLAAIFALNYSRSNKRTHFDNRLYSITGGLASLNFDYVNDKYAEDILAGALANITLQLGNNSKISFKNILNVNTTNYTTIRNGKDYENNPVDGENIKATELAFKANTFFNTQVSGDHNIAKYKAKFHWYGSFNILDQYIPDQRRLQYNQDPNTPNAPYLALISASKTSQRSGSRYYGFLNDYIYNAGSDLSKSFTLGNDELVQTVKTGYLFQVKDRLFDSRPFSIYLPKDNPALLQLPADQIFAAQNFGNGYDDGKFAFNELAGKEYRYLANTILNAAFLQFDNQVTSNLRATWGVRWESFDQLVGSVNKTDSRHVHSKKDDFLPGVNLTYKLTAKTNIRLSGSQTVIRPEFRELSPFAFYDFDLGATVTGNKELERTKITNIDLRYELYPRAGELITIGAFYKYFKSPIELFFNQTGAGSSNTFNYINADKATGYGVELEFRKKLDFVQVLKNFTLQSNVSYIHNKVEGTTITLNRPMQGQSPYLINIGLQYDVEKIGLNTTLLFNQIGRRILYVGNNDYPPVWENPRPLLDLQVAKKVFKNKGEIKLNMSDIINKEAIYYHDLNDNKKFDKATGDALAIKRRYGSNVSLSFGYNF